MSWIEQTLESLMAAPACGYRAGGAACTEPTALAAMALAACDRAEAAETACRWLVERQNRDGSLGVNEAESEPNWPTPLAVLAWQTVDAAGYASNVERAVAWILREEGKSIPQREVSGHDSTLVGWSWAAATHSWIEPTAMCVLALKRTGQGEHARTREAIRLLADRLLPEGGCNYGNTVVLGQLLRPHVLPTGIALLALLGEEAATDPRLPKSIEYLRGELSAGTAAVSLAYGLLGLTAHGARPAEAEAWLAAAGERALNRDASPFRLAALALAAANDVASLVGLPAEAAE